MKLPIALVGLGLAAELPAQTQDAVFWLDVIDLKTMAQRRGEPRAKLESGRGRSPMARSPSRCSIAVWNLVASKRAGAISGSKARNPFAIFGNSAIPEVTMAVMASKSRDTAQSC